MKVSVIIPAYNEYQTIEKIINKVIKQNLIYELLSSMTSLMMELEIYF